MDNSGNLDFHTPRLRIDVPILLLTTKLKLKQNESDNNSKYCSNKFIAVVKEWATSETDFSHCFFHVLR